MVDIDLDIPAKIDAVMALKAKRTPCLSNRGSSIGYFVPSLDGCLRLGVYERTRWQEKKLPDLRLQYIFQEGHEQERLVLKVLAEAGIDVFEQQGCGAWEKYNITWHLDGKVRHGDLAIPIEIKSMNPNVFAQIHTLDDFFKKPWTKAYLAQIQIYMLASNVDRGIFILKDKSNGTIRQINVALDLVLAEECLQACEQINAHVAAGTLPDRCTNIDKCKECNFNHICMPEMSFGTPLTVAEDPEFEKKLLRYDELVIDSKECETLYENIRDKAVAQADFMLKNGTGDGSLNIMVGDFILTGSRDKKGTFRLKIVRN